MGRVLLGSELGGGFGYAARLALIGRALAAEGHDCVAAVNDPPGKDALFEGSGIRLVAAPRAEVGQPDGTPMERFHPTSFADILWANGFDAPARLSRPLAAWHALIDRERPDLAVGAYSPLLGLAAFGRLPLVQVSQGYSLPPTDQPAFPRFREDRPALADPARILTVVAEVQRRLGHRAPETLPAFYRGAARFVLSFTELDPYRESRGEPTAGPLERLLPEVPPLPDPPRIYAYLAGDSTEVRAVVNGLVQSGLPGEIHVRDSGLGLKDAPQTRQLRWLDHAPPLEQAAARASVVIHHGGGNTLGAAFAAARPQLMVPRLLDQALLSRIVRNLGVAEVLDVRGLTAGRVAETLRHLVSDRRSFATAAHYAAAVRSRGQHGSLSPLLEACRRLLDSR